MFASVYTPRSRVMAAAVILTLGILAFFAGTSGFLSPRAAASPAQQPAPPAALNMDLSMRLVQAAADHATQNNYRMSFTVVDGGGNTVMSARMDGAGFITTEISQAKAFASAAFRQSTTNLGQSYSQNPVFWENLVTLGKPLIPAQGALPITIDGTVVGAMGASGGSAQQDEETVRAAFDAVGLP